MRTIVVADFSSIPHGVDSMIAPALTISMKNEVAETRPIMSAAVPSFEFDCCSMVNLLLSRTVSLSHATCIE
jgi:hypothetical protein